MPTLIDFAKREFEILGYYEPEPIQRIDESESEFKTRFLGWEINVMMRNSVLQLLELFSNQGHSGFSAPFAINLFTKLAKYEPLSPLTGEDDEWKEVSCLSPGEKRWQNKRCSRVFKDSTGYSYDIEAIIFQDKDGLYTSGNSKMPVTFPYIPVSSVVKTYLDDLTPVPKFYEQGGKAGE